MSTSGRCTSTGVTLYCAGTQTWSKDAASTTADYTANHCWTSGDTCMIELSSAETGMAFFGVVESNSGLFGCRVDQFDTQWFYSDTKVGESVYMCWISGLAKGTHTYQIWNGSPSQFLGVSMWVSETNGPNGTVGDGATWYSQALSLPDSTGYVTSIPSLAAASSSKSSSSAATSGSSSSGSSTSSSQSSGSADSSSASAAAAASASSLLASASAEASVGASSGASSSQTVSAATPSQTAATSSTALYLEIGIPVLILLTLAGALLGCLCCRRKPVPEGTDVGTAQYTNVTQILHIHHRKRDKSDKGKKKSHSSSGSGSSSSDSTEEKNVGLLSGRVQRESSPGEEREAWSDGESSEGSDEALASGARKKRVV